MEGQCQNGPESWKIREEWVIDREEWKDTVRRDMKAWMIREEWVIDRERWKDTVRRDLKAGRSGRNGPLTGRDGRVSARHATSHRETMGRGRKKGEKSLTFVTSSFYYK